MSAFKHICREPLVQFLAVGAILFAVYRPPGSESVPVSNHRIAIGAGEVEQLRAMFTKQRQRPPTEEELRELIDAHVQEEVLYREALAMGLDRDDTVRFFGGWEFEASDARSRLPANAGYTKGVPMGGDLANAPAGKSPTFLVAALKDPIGANLDRIQIVKGWLDAKGQLHEKIYDVVWGGNRKPDPKTGKLPAVGNTVDVANATWTNTIGATELITVWRDPDFDPKLRAFYYARVLEIPTPRWTAYDAKYFNVKAPAGASMTLQERAYTSPIWYTPAK